MLENDWILHFVAAFHFQECELQQITGSDRFVMMSLANESPPSKINVRL